jgi:hypothetical protein
MDNTFYLFLEITLQWQNEMAGTLDDISVREHSRLFGKDTGQNLSNAVFHLPLLRSYLKEPWARIILKRAVLINPRVDFFDQLVMIV